MTRNKLLLVLMIAVFLASVSGYAAYRYHVASAAVAMDDLCPMDMSPAAISQTSTSTVASKATIQSQQDPRDDAIQSATQETDVRCERPNSNGSNPDRGGQDPKKVGCGCMRKCVDGKITENYEDGKRCKVHCKPDHCDCPDPCKS